MIYKSILRHKELIIVFVMMMNFISMKSNNNLSYNLVRKVETKMTKHYNNLERDKCFEDSPARIKYLFDIIEFDGSDLLNNTSNHKYNLLLYLQDSTVIKNKYSNIDVIYILYNQNIQDYVQTVLIAFDLYKKKKISFDEFELFLIQDFNVSNQLAKNYNNQQVQKLIDLMLQYFQNDNKSNKTKGLIENLSNIKSGTEWLENLSLFEKIQPPILCPKRLVERSLFK